MKTIGRLVMVLAIEAMTTAVPANEGAIFELALRLAAATDALALLAIPLMPLAAMKPRFPKTRSASVLTTWIARNRIA